MLGSQLGYVGAYRALVEQELNGVMVSVSGQLQLEYVPFDTLVDPETLAVFGTNGCPLYRSRQRLPTADAIPGNVRRPGRRTEVGRDVRYLMFD